ncbi:glycosyltransferase [uncultured Sphingobacterium sp.]|uniref:glycosyltransferase n=1 Tax=uncultured Sphingobacterium sp. TaxID=182688 RepID=UPI0025E504B7|nr:glycosyltransferase [uncultured Sphingobacterium sp.]
MKVLHIINSLHTGGAEKLMLSTLPLLKQMGVDVDLLLLNGEETPFLLKLRQEKDINIMALGKSLYNPFNIFKLIPYLKTYEIIHVHLFPAMYYVAFAKLITRSKTTLIFTEHNTSNRRLEKAFYIPLERIVYAMYKRVVCITESVKKVLKLKIDSRDDKYKVILNGVEVSSINEVIPHSRASFGFNENEKLICMVAGFRIQKDQDTVVRSLKLLPPHYKLIFIGDGERLPQVKQLAESLNLEDRVKFLGIRTDAYSLIKMCDISVLSSHWEGFGLAAAESMACGIPTIASNVDGLAQVVSDGGLLFEKGNEIDLMNKILALEEYSYYVSIQKRCLESSKKFDVSNTVQQLQTLYRSLSNE